MRRCSRLSRTAVQARLRSIVKPQQLTFFFFNDTATTEIYTLSLHDALPISWRVLASGKPAEPRELRELRGFIQVEPVLDFAALQPGRAATDAIAQLATTLKAEIDPRVRVRQTGRIPIDDDEFGTIRQNAGVNASATLLVVLVILWLALRSWRIILAVCISLFAGLAIATASGLLLVGALNL